MKRRAFISMLAGAAGTLVLPKWRIPDPVIILPAADPLSYTVVREEIADNLYSFGLAPLKREGSLLAFDNSILLPGLKKVWEGHYNDPEFEDLFK
jgi:hypothetical protein